MLISSLLATNRVFINAQISSKKRLLEFIADHAAVELTLPVKSIYNKLLERERLGSTGLGKGIAVPHARLSNIDTPHVCLLKLNNAINYDAIDKQKVDLVFVLFAPEESTDEHLQILSSLAKIFSQQSITEQIRLSQSADDIIQVIIQAETELSA